MTAAVAAVVVCRVRPTITRIVLRLLLCFALVLHDVGLYWCCFNHVDAIILYVVVRFMTRGGAIAASASTILIAILSRRTISACTISGATLAAVAARAFAVPAVFCGRRQRRQVTAQPFDRLA